MSLTIIIPTLNEAEYCRPLFHALSRLKIHSKVLVVDGGSNDTTKDIARDFGFELILSEPGRAKQMKLGAEQAKTDYMLFLHADVKIDESHAVELSKAIDKDIQLASFPIEFDMPHWFLRLNAIFSKFAHPYFHFGDQGLWISRSLYQACGGFDRHAEVLEDQDLYQRASRICKPIKFKNKLRVSARKYRQYGVFPLQFLYYRLWLMSKFGYSKREIAKRYDRFLKTKKLNDT